MKMETAKGMKDYGPEEKMLRNSVINTIERVFELYGFNPLETPIMEKRDVLESKYAGGEEILKEMYTLTDQGDRELGLRYDLTVPLARFIALNPTVKMPFKRYQIGPVFRDGPVKTGRMRQFYQADVDIIGTESILADIQLLRITLDVFEKLGLEVEIKVNNRKLLNAMIKKAGISEDNAEDAILSLDKLEKVGEKGVLKEMQDRGIKKKNAENLLDIVSNVEEEEVVFLQTEFEGNEGAEEIIELLERLDDERVVFTPSLARGLAYYTGSIFEVFEKGGDVDSAIAAGGRYDDMIGEFVERNEKYPAVGISFGVEPICELLKGKAEVQSMAQVLVIPIGDVRQQADGVAKILRNSGVNTDIDLTDRGVSKNLDYANYYNIPFCLLIGKKEVREGKYTLKDMETGEEELVSLAELKEKL